MDGSWLAMAAVGAIGVLAQRRGSSARLYHATSRDAASAILAEGFQPEYGDAGYGVYFFDSHRAAVDYGAEGGWDGSLSDAVVLVVETSEAERLEPHPEWPDPESYQGVWWVDLAEHEDRGSYRWAPSRKLAVAKPSPYPYVVDGPHGRPPTPHEARLWLVEKALRVGSEAAHRDNEEWAVRSVILDELWEREMSQEPMFTTNGHRLLGWNDVTEALYGSDIDPQELWAAVVTTYIDEGQRSAHRILEALD